MAIVDDVSGARALLARTTHARSFAPGPLPPMALRQIVDSGRNGLRRGLSFQKEMVALLGVSKGFKIFTSIGGNPAQPLTAQRRDRRSLDDAVRWL
jgi:hypothetical protein